MPLDFGQPRRQVLFDGRVVPGAEAERDVAQVLELVNLHGASPGKIGIAYVRKEVVERLEKFIARLIARPDVKERGGRF
eukprot:9322951-Pyramimonas_sp.AAC.1